MKYPYMKFEEDKIKEIASSGDFILDVGGGKRFDKWLKNYRHLFKESSYKTFDYDSSTNPDVVGDIHNIPIDDGEVDAIICYSVLEHVSDPIKATSEMKRILKPGGKLLLYVPSIYPYHPRKGHYPDLWRFFDDTFDLMFLDWSHMEIQKVGGYFKALSFFVPYQHKMRKILDLLAHILDTLFKTNRRTNTSGFIVYAIK